MDSRRTFVTHMIGLIATPVLLSGCRRSSQPEDEARKPADPGLAPEPLGSPLPQIEPILRVRVFRVREPGVTITLGEEGRPFRARYLGYEGTGLDLSGPLTVSWGLREWIIQEADGRVTRVEADDELELTTIDNLPILLEPRGRRYPGSIRLHRRSDEGEGAFDVINHVALESYLPGVLASELFSHWRRETYLAQAVAARSFACSEQAYFSTRRHYDLTDTISSQVYAGTVDRRVAYQAVRETRGVVLSHDERLVPGYYSSCCGGLASRAVDVIGPSPINRIAPLNGRSEPDVCTEAPVYEWKVRRKADEFRKRLAAYGEYRQIASLASLESLASIELDETNPHGRPVSFQLVDANGKSFRLDAEKLMRAANFSNDDITAPRETLKSSFVTVTFENGDLAFAGHGFGHGSGLCQYGAEKLSRSGKSFQEILTWYYPGASLLESY